MEYFLTMDRSVDVRSVYQNITFRILVVLGLILNGIGSLWNVDPYHEGALFPTSVGIAEGLSVFSGVSQQYGFLGPLLVSFPIRIFGNYLIIQRIFGFFVTIVIARLFYLNLKKITSEQISRIIIVTWLMISPIWSWPLNRNALSGGYWPNQIGLIFVLLGLLLIQRESSRVHQIMAGVTVFISSQARMEFYFVWLFVTLAVLIFKGRKAKSFLLGSLLGLSLTIIFLLLQGSLQDWYAQTILVWTLTPPDVPKIGINFFLFNGMNFIGVGLVAILLLVSSYYVTYKVEKFFIRLSIQITITTTLLFATSKIQIKQKIGNFSVGSYVDYVFGNTLFSFVNLTIFVFLSGLALKLAEYRFNIVKFCDGIGVINTLYVASTLGTLSLFHNFNPDYSYMVWPLFILSVLILFKGSLNRHSSKIIETLGLATTAISAVSVLTFVLHAQGQFHPYQTKMLSGLFGHSLESVTELDRAFSRISVYSQPKKMLMVCQTGLYSTSHSGFLGLDKWTWNQQPQVMISNRFDNLEKGQTILACKLNTQDSESISQLLKLEKIRLVSNSPQFKLYKVIESYRQQ